MFAAHWQHSNLFSTCNWSKRERRIKTLLCFLVSFLCDCFIPLKPQASNSFHPIFSIGEQMSWRSRTSIFKWTMKKAATCWSLGQSGLYWQRPLRLQMRKCNPLLVPFVSRNTRGRVGIESNLVVFKACTRSHTHTFVHRRWRRPTSRRVNTNFKWIISDIHN